MRGRFGKVCITLLASLLPACARVQVEPIEVKPIHITADINIRVQRQLDDFFAFEDKSSSRPASQPATSTGPAVNNGGVQ